MGGAAPGAQLSSPVGIAVDGSGNLFIADTYNNRIRQVSAATGVITTVAGNGTRGFSGDGGAATNAQLNVPSGVAVDGSGNLFIADTNSHRIRKVSAATGVITTLAGNGTQGFGGDWGAATSALLYGPVGIAVDGSGNVFVADRLNSRIRKVSAATGVITTVAGNGTRGFSGDGRAATDAQLNVPSGVAVDGSGNLFIADTNSHRIRKVSAATGVMTTLAVNSVLGFSGDGGAATGAQLYDPFDVAVDGRGSVFIADFGNHRIRQLTTLASVAAALPAAAVQLYPNPAPGAFTVLVPAEAGTLGTQAELLNALGQPVRRQAAVIGAPFMMETAGLAPGVYTLRLQAGTTVLAKRVAVQ